ncbi:hypothetical protein B0G84_6220 [Paraburkholderia sp. BL8N3]|nr:hypothetical protein B0G84_6220 [Paraburkholderia sp. BL8N3]
MSVGIDIAACVSVASGVRAISASGQPVACAASDGTNGVLQVVHLSLVDSSATASDFDYAQAAGFFALAFTMVVGVWMVSASAGAILDFIRRV